MQGEGQPIAGVLPDEAPPWSDTWMIAKEAEHPEKLHAWMNHMASAANGQATVWFDEAPTSQQACDYAETYRPAIAS